MTEADLQTHLTIIWIIVSASLVLFMQAGFTALESGLTRAKNTINVAVKNITDFILSVLIFWAVGFGLMFGADVHGWMGSSGFGLNGLDQPMDYAIFVFQATFAGTAATIVSGAVAERIRFLAYALVSIVVTGWIYPVSGHWVWGDGGWLAELGMVDFAGSTVVHSLGGWVGLAGAIVLGPRLGRFNPDGSDNKIPGHSLVLAVVGVLVLWFGWFGFNGGSTLSADPSVARIIANTLLAAAAGGVGCFLLSLVLSRGEVHIEKLLNGIIGGLVGITAGCAMVAPTAAVAIGLSAGIVAYFAEWLLVRVLRVDDPVNAIPTHAFCGAWGTLVLAFAAPASALPTGDPWAQFGVQLLGVGVVFAWGFGCGLVLFWLLRGIDFLRVSPDAEQSGLNVHEHGASSGFLETMEIMHNIASAQQAGNGDLTRRVPVEIGSEAGELALIFNRFLDNYQATIVRIQRDTEQFHQETSVLSETCAGMSDRARTQGGQIDQATQAIHQLAASTGEVARDAGQMAEEAQKAARETEHGKTVVLTSLAALEQVATEVEGAARVIASLGQNASEVGEILRTIQGIAARTDILALNAAIEAEHAADRGQGFKVVANEVRGLAQQTQSSAQEIEMMLQQFQRRVGEAMKTIETSRDKARASADQTSSAHDSLEAITTTVAAIAAMTTRIAVASQAEGQVASAVSEHLDQINGIARETEARAADARGRGENVARLASRLQQLMQCFQVSGERRGGVLV